jgi:hypothetical protein
MKSYQQITTAYGEIIKPGLKIGDSRELIAIRNYYQAPNSAG